MSSVATIRSELPARTALPAKQRPATTRSAAPAREPRPEREGAAVEAGDDGVVGVAGPPAAALGEEDRRSRIRSISSNSRSFFPWPSRPGCRRGPCSRRRGPRSAARSPNRSPLIRARAGDQAVGRGAREQLLELAAGPLRGDRQPAVLDEAVPDRTEIGDVLARGAAPSAWRRSTASGRAARRASGPVARAPPRGRHESPRRPGPRLCLRNRRLRSHRRSLGIRCRDWDSTLAQRNLSTAYTVGFALPRDGAISRARSGGRAPPGGRGDRCSRDGARARLGQRPHARGDDPVSGLRRRPAAYGVARAGTSGRSRSGWTTTTSTGVRGSPASR